MNVIWPELLSQRTQRATFDIPIEISEGTTNKQDDRSPVPINVSEGTAEKQTKQADRSPELRRSKSGRPSSTDRQADHSHEVRQTKFGRPLRHPKRYGFLAASPIASFIDDLEQ